MNSTGRKLPLLSEAQILGFYSQLYPTLLSYGAPIIPTVHIFRAASPEVWNEILYDFSSMLLTMYAIVAKDTPSENFRLQHDEALTGASVMLSYCIGNAGPDELPLLLNDIFGEGSVTKRGGGKKKQFSFRDFFAGNSNEGQKGGMQNDLDDLTNEQLRNEYEAAGFRIGAAAPRRETMLERLRRQRRNQAAGPAAAGPNALVASGAAGPLQGNLQRNLGIGADEIVALQRELEAPEAAAAVTNIVARIGQGQALDLATLSTLSTSRQLAVLYQVYQTVGNQRAMQMVAQAAHCDALVAAGGAFSSTRIGEYTNQLREQLNEDNRIIQRLLAKQTAGEEITEEDYEGLSEDGRSIMLQIVTVIKSEQQKIGLTSALLEIRKQGLDHKREFYESLQRLGVATASSILAWFAVDYAMSPSDDETNPLATNAASGAGAGVANAAVVAAVTNIVNATAPEAAAAADSVGWGAWLGQGALDAVRGAIRFTTVAAVETGRAVAQGINEGTEASTGKTVGEHVSNTATALDPRPALQSAKESMIESVKGAALSVVKPVLVLGVGAAGLISFNRWLAYRRASSNINFANRQLMGFIRGIETQYITQLWAGYMRERQTMIATVSSTFGQRRLTHPQILALEAAGGIERFDLVWKTEYSATLQTSGMQQIINTLPPGEANRLQLMINAELQNARDKVLKAMVAYQAFLQLPIADQAIAGANNVITSCSTAALGAVTRTTNAIMAGAKVAAAAAVTGGAGVVAAGAAVMRARANAENQELRAQIQRLLEQQRAEQAAAARRAEEQAAAAAAAAAANAARRAANNAAAAAAANAARRAANNAAAAAARRAEEEAAAAAANAARRAANNAAAAAAAAAEVPANALVVRPGGGPLLVNGLAPAMAAMAPLPRINIRSLQIVMGAYDAQQRAAIGAGEAGEGAIVARGGPRINEVDGGARRMRRRHASRKQKTHKKKATRKH